VLAEQQQHIGNCEPQLFCLPRFPADRFHDADPKFGSGAVAITATTAAIVIAGNAAAATCTVTLTPTPRERRAGHVELLEHRDELQPHEDRRGT